MNHQFAVSKALHAQLLRLAGPALRPPATASGADDAAPAAHADAAPAAHADADA